MVFSEDSRVKIPCILHLARLCYQYLSLKNVVWDEENNIFPDVFREADARINPGNETSRAPIGYMAIARDELTTYQGFKSFVPNQGHSTPFIYYTVKGSLKAITQYASGSTFKEISGTTLKTVKICLPAPAVVDQYTSTVDSIFKRKDVLELENQQLTQHRDWLLPMFKNGQVTVV